MLGHPTSTSSNVGEIASVNVMLVRVKSARCAGRAARVRAARVLHRQAPPRRAAEFAVCGDRRRGRAGTQRISQMVRLRSCRSMPKSDCTLKRDAETPEPAEVGVTS